MADQFIGRRVNLGVAREIARGTFAPPAVWVPRTTLTYDSKAGRHTEEESLGVIDDSDASFVTEKWAEGDLEGEIRHNSIGYFFYAMLGTVAPAVLVGGEAAVWDHTFTLLQTNNHQSLSFLIDDPIGSLAFPLVMLDSLTINLEVGGLATFSSTWMGRSGNDYTKITPSYTLEQKFRATDLTFKHAVNVAGLGAAPAVPIKSMSMTFSKNLLRSMILGTIEPDDLFNQQIGIEGTMTLDYTNRTPGTPDFKPLYLDEFNQYRAAEFDFINNSVIIGNASNPEMTFTFPRIAITEWESDRSLNDISTETFSFKAHRDISTPPPGSDLIQDIVLRNQVNIY